MSSRTWSTSARSAGRRPSGSLTTFLNRSVRERHGACVFRSGWSIARKLSAELRVARRQARYQKAPSSSSSASPPFFVRLIWAVRAFAPRVRLIQPSAMKRSEPAKRRARSQRGRSGKLGRALRGSARPRRVECKQDRERRLSGEHLAETATRRSRTANAERAQRSSSAAVAVSPARGSFSVLASSASKRDAAATSSSADQKY